MVSMAPLQVLRSPGMPGLRAGGSGVTVPSAGPRGLSSGLWRRKSRLGKKSEIGSFSAFFFFLSVFQRKPFGLCTQL